MQDLIGKNKTILKVISIYINYTNIKMNGECKDGTGRYFENNKKYVKR